MIGNERTKRTNIYLNNNTSSSSSSLRSRSSFLCTSSLISDYKTSLFSSSSKIIQQHKIIVNNNNNNNSNNNNTSFNKEEEIINKIKKWKQQLEKHTCPISQQLMIDPVIIESGHTFERDSIEEWLKSNNTCPITRKKIKTTLILPNINAKSTINENIEIFIKKVIKNCKIWSNDNNLIDICLELINYSLELIKNNNNFKNLKKEMQKLQFKIIFKEQNEDKLFNNYILFINKVTNLNYKIELFQKLENKLTKENLLQKYYTEIINLLIEYKNNDKLLNEVFIKYCKINYIDNLLINKLFNYLENNDNLILDYLIILFKDTNYSRNIILQILIDLNIEYNNNNEFQNFITNKIVDKTKLIYLFKNLIVEDNLININLKILFNLIKNCNELDDELQIIINKLPEITNDLIFLKKVFKFHLQKSNQTIESIKLKQTNTINNLQQENTNLEKELLNLQEWKNQQIINNFKNKYPKYNYVNIINIETPLNVKKEELFSGNEESNNDECAIILWLDSLQYENEEKEISSVKIKYSIDSINLNDNKNYEYNFTKIEGYGNVHFKQSNFIPIIKNDKQIFSIVIGMKKLEIEFKTNNSEKIDDDLMDEFFDASICNNEQ
ncbi:hypothetical protein ABK040_011423 [Willaertia magna]